MKFVVKFCLVFMCVQEFGASQFRPDYEYHQEMDGWIKFHLVPATWKDAMIRCRDEGATLASPLTNELLGVMQKFAVSTIPPRSLYTGFQDNFFRGEYYSLEGTHVQDTHLKWAENEPDNRDNGEDCLVMNPEGLLADVKCNQVFSYTCFRRQTEDMPDLNECGTIDPEYRKDERTGSCYKYHNVAQHWSRAFETCAAEGGHLAIVNSREEATVLKQLFFNGPPSVVTNIHKKMVLLGFHYNDDLGLWLTVNGDTLEQTGYAMWEYGEPNNFTDLTQNGEGEYCGAMDMSKTMLGLNDLWCGYHQPFICEKDPKTLPTTTEKPQTTTESIETIFFNMYTSTPKSVSDEESEYTQKTPIPIYSTTSDWKHDTSDDVQTTTESEPKGYYESTTESEPKGYYESTTESEPKGYYESTTDSESKDYYESTTESKPSGWVNIDDIVDEYDNKNTDEVKIIDLEKDESNLSTTESEPREHYEYTTPKTFDDIVDLELVNKEQTAAKENKEEIKVLDNANEGDLSKDESNLSPSQKQRLQFLSSYLGSDEVYNLEGNQKIFDEQAPAFYTTYKPNYRSES